MWCGAPRAVEAPPDAVSDEAWLRSAPWQWRVAARIGDAVEGASLRIIAFLRLRGRPRRGIWKKIFPEALFPVVAPSRKVGMVVVAVFVALAMMHSAQAAGTLDQIATIGQSEGAGWLATGLSLAYGIASAIIVVLGITHFTRSYIRDRSIPAAAKSMLDFGLSVALPWVLIGSLTGGVNAGGGGLSILSIAQQVGASYCSPPGSGNCLAPITPSGVLQNGLTIATEVLQNGFNAMNSAEALPPLSSNWWTAAGQVASEAGGIIMAMVFGLIMIVLLLLTWVAIVYVFFTLAVELVMVTFEVYFVLPLGAWTAGFQVGPMAGFAGNYWGAILAAIIRFLVIWALVAIGNKIALLWPAQIAAVHFNQIPTTFGALGGFVAGGFKAIVAVCIDAFVLKTVFGNAAALAESVMSGRSALGGSGAQFTGGAGSAAGGIALGAVTGGAGGAALGAMSGARGAASSALISRMRGSK